MKVNSVRPERLSLDHSCTQPGQGQQLGRGAAGRPGATVGVVCWAFCSEGKCGGSVLAKDLCSVWGVLTGKCGTKETRVPSHKSTESK